MGWDHFRDIDVHFPEETTSMVFLVASSSSLQYDHVWTRKMTLTSCKKIDLGILRNVIAALGASLVVGLLCPTQSSCYNEKEPAEIYSTARPAIVMVESTFELEFQTPKATVDLRAFENLSSSRAAALSLSDSPQGTSRAMFRELLRNPLNFVKRSDEKETVSGRYTGKSGGSGFIVTPEGHVVTNYHCVKIDEKRMDMILGKHVPRTDVEQSLNDLARKLSILGGLAAPGPERTAWARALRRSFARFYGANGELKEKVSIEVWTTPNTSEAQEAPRKYPARIIAEGELGPGRRDVAILKMDGRNLPTVTLGDDENLRVGSRIYLIGFPGAAFDGRALSESSRLEPTIVGGLISSKKAVRQGWTLLQIDMNVASGSSGGPIFNRDGEVVGIASFALMKRSGGRTPDRIHFAVPVSVISTEIEKAGVRYRK